MLQQEIYSNADSEDQLAIKMAKHVEYPLFSGSCKNTNNCPQTQLNVCDTLSTLPYNDTSRMTDQMKRGIEDPRLRIPAAPLFLESLCGRCDVPPLGVDIGFYTLLLVQIFAGYGGAFLSTLPPDPLHSPGTEPTATDGDGK